MASLCSWPRSSLAAKLFYLDSLETLYQASYIESALKHLQKLLGVQEIDTFILSFKNSPTPSLLKTAWKQLEQHRESGQLVKLGVADFSYEQLDALLSDPSIGVKPVVNQINVSQCCQMPSALIELAKRHNVELLHNGDCSGNWPKSNYHDCTSTFLFTKECCRLVVIRDLHRAFATKPSGWWKDYSCSTLCYQISRFC